MKSSTALVADPRCRSHLAGRDHPERPERFDAVMEGLRRAELLERLIPVNARSATIDELLLVHKREYLLTAQHDVSAGYHSLTTGDTDITPHSWEVALLAAGGVLSAILAY